jgi:hypothetical protein
VLTTRWKVVAKESGAASGKERFARGFWCIRPRIPRSVEERPLRLVKIDDRGVVILKTAKT